MSANKSGPPPAKSVSDQFPLMAGSIIEKTLAIPIKKVTTIVAINAVVWLLYISKGFSI